MFRAVPSTWWPADGALSGPFCALPHRQTMRSMRAQGSPFGIVGAMTTMTPSPTDGSLR